MFYLCYNFVIIVFYYISIYYICYRFGFEMFLNFCLFGVFLISFGEFLIIFELVFFYEDIFDFLRVFLFLKFYRLILL